MLKKIILLICILSSFCFADELDNQISQMIIVGFMGDSVHSKGFKKVLKQVKKGEISGVILFKKNIKTKKDLIKMNKKLLKANKITPFISIDNEGGNIQRFDFETFLSAKDVSELSIDEARNEYEKMADLEKELLINFNFAPCVDLEINKNSIISSNKRSYSDDYKTVVKYSKIFIEEHNKKKIITSIKHFPGHGSVSNDTHLDFVNSTETFMKDELMPYYELKNYDKLNTVMVSHIFNSNFDNEYPASLSKKTIDFLREGIGFKGVIVSDDFDMGAIKKNYSLRKNIVLAVNAGVDILLFSNNIDKYDKDLAQRIKKIIKEEILKGTIDPKTIQEANSRILKLKQEL